MCDHHCNMLWCRDSLSPRVEHSRCRMQICAFWPSLFQADLAGAAARRRLVRAQESQELFEDREPQSAEALHPLKYFWQETSVARRLTDHPFDTPFA